MRIRTFFTALVLVFLFSSINSPAFACSVSSSSAWEGKNLVLTITDAPQGSYTADVSRNGSNLSGLIVQYMNNNTYQIVVENAMDGNYSVIFNGTTATGAGQSCNGSSQPVHQAASPSHGWVSSLYPGFGPDPSLGLRFFTDNLTSFLISGALFLLVVLSLLILLIGGVMWITAGGNKEGMAKARSTITYALIGLALGFASFIILSVLSAFFGQNIIWTGA
ncbi:MAG: hypothetical protein M1484_02640 [Patescibacteria group bacterium]|nr:hypothetical protein [Patescibacteria group bacterium]MCL5431979.1 hypothetical protein [Patescibacteria group bacterium]